MTCLGASSQQAYRMTGTIPPHGQHLTLTVDLAPIKGRRRLKDTLRVGPPFVFRVALANSSEFLGSIGNLQWTGWTAVDTVFKN
mmetsp:Transcript_3453/g.4989  ORF Transcript_3453/g.4989 Transcript_3453/m.4989 type:complete len:84 (+) Transcript_3453:597-848(+)